MIRIEAPRSVDDIDHIRETYFNAFPADERRPWESVIADTDTPMLYGIYDGDAIVGMVTLWDFPQFVYIEHLAVDASRRGLGIGAATLSIIAGRYAGERSVVLECEPPTLSEFASRRVEFYRRNGFDVIDRDYVQPPYSPELSPVRLWLMSTRAIDAAMVTRTLHIEVYGLRDQS